MIYVADVSSIGIQHEQFNAAFLALLQKANPNEKMLFFADGSHIEFQKSKLENISFEQISIFNKRGGYQEFVRAYHQYKSLTKIVRKVEKFGGKSLFVLLIHPFAHFLFKLFNKSKLDVILVMHGELESLKFNKHFVNKIWGWFLRSALLNVRPHVKYIILGGSIHHNLLRVLPEFAKQKTTILDHPYPFEKQLDRNAAAEKRIVFSSIGVATIHKYSHKFFEIAARVKQSAHGNAVKFNVSGRVYKDMEAHLNDDVNYKKDFGYYTREELDAQLAESTFAVFYYDNANYSLCASGAFWDAINAELPFLYVHNDYFDHYSNLFGGIGMVFDTPEQLNSYITKIAENGIPMEQYKTYLANIRQLKADQIQGNESGTALKALVA